MIRFLRRHSFIILLILIETALFLTNYKPGTYLVGWDNVYPELNFPLNLQRSLYTIWQEYRGLGAIDGMAHSALIPHTLSIFVTSLFLPHNILRYVYNFFLHLLGGIGMYILIKDLLHKESPRQNNLTAFFGALFYEFNLITVQMFFTPLEVFSYHFAFLPILIHLVLSFLKDQKKKTLFFFIASSLFSTPQAHVPSVFIVYFITVFVIFFFYLIHHKKKAVKPILYLLIALLGTNAFWGFPYVYSTIYASKTIVSSKINEMSTDNVVLRNKAFGNFTNVALLRGFTLDYVDYQPSGENDFMMKPWRAHLQNLPVLTLSVLFFLLAFIGLIRALLHKEKSLYPFAVMGIFAFLMMGSDIPVLSLFSAGLQKLIPLFYNVFRFTFTKFSLVYVFCYTIFFCYALRLLLHKFHHVKRLEGIGLIGILLIFYYILPSFKGNFLYANLKNTLPPSYREAISYLNTKNWAERIATFPQPSFWGWTYYQWNARGSGFQWYGIPQATLDGAFYPWSSQNENYYWEISQALYTRDLSRFENVLKKYQIKWVMIDESIISPFSPRALYTEKLEALLQNSQAVTFDKSFDQLKLYRVSSEATSYVTLKNNLPTVNPSYIWNNYDKAYEDQGDYISESGTQSTNQSYYPFRSLFSGRNQEELEFTTLDEVNYITFQSHIPPQLAGQNLIIPPLNSNEVLQFNETNLEDPSIGYPEIYLDGEQINYPKGTLAPSSLYLPYVHSGILEIKIPKRPGVYSFDSSQSDIMLNSVPRNCDEMKQGKYSFEKISEEGNTLLRLTSINADNCIDINLPNLTQKNGYYISVESRNIQGTSLLFGISSPLSNRTELEVYLPNSNKLTTSHFVLPPLEQYGLGYTFTINSASIGRQKSVNDLGKITVNPIPYNFLTSLKIINTSFPSSVVSTKKELTSIDHPNPSYYKIELPLQLTTNNLQPTTLILSQSYNDGWKAYEISCKLSVVSCKLQEFLPFIFGKEIKDHILISNWANGWNLEPTTPNSQPTTIIVYYLPQILEFIGLALLPLPFIVLIVYKPKKVRHPPTFF